MKTKTFKNKEFKALIRYNKGKADGIELYDLRGPDATEDYAVSFELREAAPLVQVMAQMRDFIHEQGLKDTHEPDDMGEDVPLEMAF